MARPKHTPSLTETRAAVKALKAHGILPKSYKVSSVRQSHTGKILGPMSGGRTVQELVKEFDDVLSGKAEVFKKSAVEKASRKNLQSKVFTSGKTGKRTDYVIVPTFANEKVTVTKDGKIERYNINAGIRTLEIPVEYHKLEDWLNSAAGQKYIHQKGFKRFGFRYRGGYSNTYRNIADLFADFAHYQSVQDALKGSPYAQRQEYLNFELVEIVDQKTWNAQREKAKVERAKERRAKSHHKKTRRKK